MAACVLGAKREIRPGGAAGAGVGGLAATTCTMHHAATGRSTRQTTLLMACAAP